MDTPQDIAKNIGIYTFRDAADKRLWHSYKRTVAGVGEVKTVGVVEDHWKVSQHWLDLKEAEKAYDQLLHGANPADYAPPILFFVCKVAFDNRNMELVRNIAKVARTRIENREFDEFGDWTKANEQKGLLV